MRQSNWSASITSSGLVNNHVSPPSPIPLTARNPAAAMARVLNAPLKRMKAWDRASSRRAQVLAVAGTGGPVAGAAEGHALRSAFTGDATAAVRRIAPGNQRSWNSRARARSGLGLRNRRQRSNASVRFTLSERRATVALAAARLAAR